MKQKASLVFFVRNFRVLHKSSSSNMIQGGESTNPVGDGSSPPIGPSRTPEGVDVIEDAAAAAVVKLRPFEPHVDVDGPPLPLEPARKKPQQLIKVDSKKTGSTVRSFK